MIVDEIIIKILINEQLDSDEKQSLINAYNKVPESESFKSVRRKLMKKYHPDRIKRSIESGKEPAIPLEKGEIGFREIVSLLAILEKLESNISLSMGEIETFYNLLGPDISTQIRAFAPYIPDLQQQQQQQQQQQGGPLPEAYYNAAQMVLDSTEIISFLRNYIALTNYALQVGIKDASERTGSAKRFATSMIDEIQRLNMMHTVEIGMELMKIEKRLYSGSEDVYLLSNLDTNLDLRERFTELMKMLLPKARNGYSRYVASFFDGVQDMGTFVKNYRLLVPYDTRYTENQKAILLSNFNILMEAYKEAGRAHFRGPNQRELERLMNESTITNMGTNGNVREAFDRIYAAAFKEYNPRGIR